MTKDDAVIAIEDEFYTLMWISKKDRKARIREILDQIAPAEFITSDPGHVLVRMTESDFRLLRVYWAMKEMFDDRPHSQGSQEGTAKTTDGASR